MTANGPLSDTVAGRLAVRYSNLDGTVPNVAASGRNGNVTVGAARGSLLWLPGEDTTVTLTAFHDRRNADAPRFVWLQNPAYPQSAVNPAGNIRWRDTGTSLKVEHDFRSVRLTSLSSYKDSRSIQPFDLTDGLIYSAMTSRPEALFDLPYADYADIRFRERSMQQEIRLSSRDKGRFNWTAGLNFYRSQFSNDTVAVASPAAFNFQTQNGIQDNRLDTNSLAAFGEGTVALTDRLKATLGLRYTHERKDADYQFNGNGNPAAYPYAHNRLSLSDSFMTGRTGLSYEWSPTLMTYATVSRGAVSAGYPVVQANGPVSGQAESPYPPSTSWTVEAGFKSMWLDRRLGLNGAVFHNDVRNGHLIVFNPGQLFFGSASLDYRSKGAELEAVASLGSSLKLGASLGYTSAELVDVPGDSTTGARSGNRVPNMPRLNSALSLQYDAAKRIGRMEGRLKVGLAWQYVGKRAADVKESFDLPGYRVLNARLGWQQGNWEVYGFATNLLDEKYLVAGQAWTANVSSVRVGQPRVIGLGATIRF